MATQTYRMTMTKSAYAKWSSPYTVFPTNSSTQYIISPEDAKANALYFGGGSFPASLKRNNILGARVCVYVSVGYYTGRVSPVDGSFNPSTLTAYNRPLEDGGSIAMSGTSGGASGGWQNLVFRGDSDYNAGLSFAKDGGFNLMCDNYTTVFDNWYARTVLSGGGAPYIDILYDDSSKALSQVSFSNRPSGKVYPNRTVLLQWRLSRSSATSGVNCIDDTFVQQSAKFFWRVQGASSWNQISISGATYDYTVPANTFPNGSTIEYYLSVTDTDGTTSSTSTFTFYTPATQITPQDSPTSGYANPRNEITFSWFFSNGSVDYGQTSASFFWRVQGASSWTTVQADGSTQHVVIPANTFPVASTIEWYISGTDSSGYASQSDVYAFSTAAAVIYAICRTPVGSVEDGSSWIRMIWTLQSADGYPASRTQVWWKKDSDENIPANWHELLNEASTVTDISVAPGTFPAGKINWQVVATNIDETTAPSEAYGFADFICVDAPDPVQGLRATAVPLSTISWQSEGQEAYEITIDGEVVQRAFGSDVYSWQVPSPLADGAHSIQVRIQGEFGLWSQPSETFVSIANSPETSLPITGEFGVDAILTAGAAAGEDAPELHWYRDGKYIARTTGTPTFRDRLVLGPHDYFVEIWHTSGNYTRSETVSGILSTNTKRIAPLDDAGAEWLELRLSENSADEESFSWQQTQSLQHVTGAEFPALDSSPYQDEVANYNVAFPTVEECRQLEAMRGKTVILKSRGHAVMIGSLNNLQKRATLFYTAYTFSLQRIHCEDFVNYDQTN